MRKFDQYRVGPKDVQNSAFYNARLQDLDERIHSLEEMEVSYQGEIEKLRGLNLELVQNAIANSLASVEEQTKLIGLMTFFIDGQERPLQQGAVTFSVPSADLAKITDAGFATLIAKSTPAFRMTGPITEINVDAGEITIVVTAADGEGVFEEWILGVGFLAAGQDGVNYRGDYDAEETYFARDAVYHAATRSTYIATADEPAAAPPSAGWALLAAGGTDGEDGTDGVFTEIADQAEAEAGTDNEKGMTPLRTKEAVTARLASQVEAEAGTDNTKLMTPLRTAEAINAIASGGFSLISTTDVSSGTPAEVVFTGLDEYEEILFIFQDITHNDGSNSNYIHVSASHDGGNTYGDYKLTSTTDVNPAYHLQGFLNIKIAGPGNVPLHFHFFDGFDASTITGAGMGQTGDAPDVILSPIQYPSQISVSASQTLDAIKFSWELGANFATGTIKFYAR